MSYTSLNLRVTEAKKYETFLNKKVDEQIKAAGSFGRYQFMVIFVTQLLAWIFCGNFSTLSFASLPPSILCQNGTTYMDICQGIHTCPANFTIVSSHGFHGLAEDWPNLFTDSCTDGKFNGKPNPINTLLSVFLAASGFSFFPVGLFSDKFGRKIAMIAGLIGIISCGVGMAFAKTFTVFSVLQVAVAIAFGCFYVPTLTYVSELSLMKYRLLMTFSMSWGVSYFFVGLLAMVTLSWRTYLLAANIAGLPLLLVVLFYAESPRYLLTEAEYGKAADALNLIAKVNGRKVRFTEEQLRCVFGEKLSLMKAVEEGEHVSLWFVIRQVMAHKRLLAVTAFIMWYQFFANVLGTAVHFNLADFAMSPYMTMISQGLMRFWTPILIGFLDLRYKNFKRRTFMFVSLTTVLIPLSFGTVGKILLQANIGNSIAGFEMAVSAILVFANAMNFGLVWFAFTQLMLEVFPTVIRNIAVACISIVMTTGGSVGSQVINLVRYWNPAPYFICEVAFLFLFVAALYVQPETKGKSVPDTFEDLEEIFDSDQED